MHTPDRRRRGGGCTSGSSRRGTLGCGWRGRWRSSVLTLCRIGGDQQPKATGEDHNFSSPGRCSSLRAWHRFESPFLLILLSGKKGKESSADRGSHRLATSPLLQLNGHSHGVLSIDDSSTACRLCANRTVSQYVAPFLLPHRTLYYVRLPNLCSSRRLPARLNFRSIPHP